MFIEILKHTGEGINFQFMINMNNVCFLGYDKDALLVKYIGRMSDEKYFFADPVIVGNVYGAITSLVCMSCAGDKCYDRIEIEDENCANSHITVEMMGR